MTFRLNELSYCSFITCLTLLFSISYTSAKDCNETAPEARFNCHPEDNPSQDECEKRGCCWQPSFSQLTLSAPHDPGVPSCYYPLDYPSYEVVSNESWRLGERYHLHISPFNSSYLLKTISELTVEIGYEAQQRLRIKIYDPYYSARYQVPLPVPKVDTKATDVDYNVEIKGNPFAIIVTRKTTNETL